MISSNTMRGFFLAGAVAWVAIGVFAPGARGQTEVAPPAQDVIPADIPEHVQPQAGDYPVVAPDTSPRPVVDSDISMESDIESFVPVEGAEAPVGHEHSTGVDPSAAPPQEYTIQKGDTLWDICAKFLDNPWYWPTLWSLNEYIANPHLIFPGDKLVFRSGSAVSPPRLDIETGRDRAFAPEESMIEPLETDLPPPEPQFITAEPDPDDAVRLKSLAYIVEKRVRYLGEITHSGEPKLNLATGDRVYLKFYRKRNVGVGDQFQVVRRVENVKDPDSLFGSIGTLLRRVATLRVVSIHRHTVEAVIADSEDGVTREDRFVEYTSPIRVVSPFDVDTALNGRIAAAETQQYLISMHDFVFLNIGNRQGVRDGMRLLVVRRGDGVSEKGERRLPDVPVGRLLVVETGSNTSTAYVTDLRDSLQVGDRVAGRLN